MISVKINGKPYQFPTCYDDVTVAQYLKLMDSTGLTYDIAVFTDFSEETLRKATIIGLESVIKVMGFLRELPVFPYPGQVGKYKLPKSIIFESLGQFEDLRSELKRWPKKKTADFTTEDTKTLIDMYISACAIYCQKIRDGQYDSEKAIAMKPELLNCKVTEIIGAGSFFLTKPMSLFNGTTTHSPTQTQPSKKKKPASHKSVKRSGSTRR